MISADDSIKTVGLLTLIVIGGKLIYNLIHFAYTTFIGRWLRHGIDPRKCGPWAVITGSSSGIGKAYAHKLAAAGLNVVMISNQPEELESTAQEIKLASSLSIQVKTIVVDFTKSDDSVYDKIRSELTGLQIGVLVNNVGMALNPEPFGLLEDENRLMNIINCNIVSTCRMCHLIVPQMARRRSGVIINIGSITSTYPAPFVIPYAASKAYVEKFSKDLAMELRPLGVIVQTVQPSFVATNMTDLKPSFRFPTADTFVTAALGALGLEEVTSGYWYHKIEIYWSQVLNFFARGLFEKVMFKYFNHLFKATSKNIKMKSY